MTDAFLANTDVTKLDEVYYDMRGNVTGTNSIYSITGNFLTRATRKQTY